MRYSWIGRYQTTPAGCRLKPGGPDSSDLGRQPCVLDLTEPLRQIPHHGSGEVGIREQRVEFLRFDRQQRQILGGHHRGGTGFPIYQRQLAEVVANLEGRYYVVSFADINLSGDDNPHRVTRVSLAHNRCSGWVSGLGRLPRHGKEGLFGQAAKDGDGSQRW